MAFRFSTGFKNAILDNKSVSDFINEHADGFELVLYAGTAPETPDAAATGTKLVAYVGTDTATNAHLDMAAAAADGVLTKSTSQAWKGTAIATDDAGYFRLQTKTDGEGASTTLPRIQGVVGTTGADFNMSSVAITSGVEYECDYFAISFVSA